MTLIEWLPSLTTTAIFGVVLWLCRNLIATRLSKSVQHEFDTKLESLRSELREKEELLKADLRSKEADITALRGGVMTAMANRQVALDNRRLEAVDQLWSAFTALGPAKAVSNIMASVNFEIASEEGVRNAKIREMFTMMTSGIDHKKIDYSISAKARPFVSPMAWALFSAYQSIVTTAIIKLEILKSGLSAKGLLKEVAISTVIKAALPEYSEYIEKHGESGYHHLLDALENKLLDELRKMMAGVDADKASVERAAEILRLSNELVASAKKEGVS